MSDTPNLRNIKNIDGGGSTYIVTGNDDVVNVDTSVGAKTLQIPNIKDGKLQLFYKPIYVNDTGNNAAANVIRITTTGGDTINGSPFIDIDINGAAVKLISTGLTTWLAVFGSATSPSGSDEKVAVNATDVLPEFLENKLVQGTNITFDILDSLGVKSIRINSTGGGGGGSVTVNRTVFVSENGDDLTGVVADWSKPFRTIAAASAAAAVGDTIYVFAGTYVETVIPFQTQKYYYLEAGATVQGSGINLIDDLSSSQNFYIFGHGELVTGAGQSVINIANSATKLHLECYKITNNAGTSLGTIGGDYFYIKADQLENTAGGFAWYFTNAASGTLLFDYFDARSGDVVVQADHQGQPADRATVLFKGNSLISNTSNRDPAFNLTHNIFSRFVFEVNDYNGQLNTITTTGIDCSSTSAETIFRNSNIVSERFINAGNASQILIENCNIVCSDTLNPAVYLTTGTDVLCTIKHSYIESNHVPIRINEGSDLQALNSQFFATDVSAALDTSAGAGTSVILLANCQFYTGSGTLGLSTSLASSELRILSSCSSNQPVQAQFTNAVAGTNIVVDAQAILLRQFNI